MASDWELNSLDGEAHYGMLYTARHPDPVGTVDVVNAVRYMPLELGIDMSIDAAFGADSDDSVVDFAWFQHDPNDTCRGLINADKSIVMTSDHE